MRRATGDLEAQVGGLLDQPEALHDRVRLRRPAAVAQPAAEDRDPAPAALVIRATRASDGEHDRRVA